MTVLRVIGNINGHMFNFIHGGNKWSVDAPESYPDGSYICEVWAYDEAGNIGYATARLWMYDGRCTKIEWIDNPYKVRYLTDGPKATFLSSGYICRYMKCCSEA